MLIVNPASLIRTVAISTLLALSICTRASAQTHLIPLRIATSPIDIGAEPFYAQDLGLFKKAGFDVTITMLSNGAAIASGLIGGSFDVAQSNVVTLANAHERGLPFVMIAPAGLYSSKAPTTVCGVAKNSPITTAADLNGKTLGVTGILNITQIAFDMWIAKNGGDVSTIKYVEVPFADALPALVTGRIAAGVLVDPDMQLALNSGQVRVLANCYDAVAPEFLIGAFFSTSSYAAANPDVIKRFAAVIREAGRWANSHPVESAKILEKWTHITAVPGMARIVYADTLSAAQIQPLIDASARFKALQATFPAALLFAPGAGAP